MRVFVRAHHQYPARLAGPGGGRVTDGIVKGLAELGHDVSYQLLEGARADEPLPEGVRLVSEPVWDADIMHVRSDSELAWEAPARGMPCVATCHTDLNIWNQDRHVSRDNWIYVSRHLAATYGSERYVLNGALTPASSSIPRPKAGISYLSQPCGWRGKKGWRRRWR